MLEAKNIETAVEELVAVYGESAEEFAYEYFMESLELDDIKTSMFWFDVLHMVNKRLAEASRDNVVGRVLH